MVLDTLSSATHRTVLWLRSADTDAIANLLKIDTLSLYISIMTIAFSIL